MIYTLCIYFPVNRLRICLYGIKGSGLAALAAYLSDYGLDVYGYDKSEELFTDSELKKHNIVFKDFSYFSFDNEDCDILIYSSAFREMFLKETLRRYIKIEYHEFVAFILRGYKVIGVSGTHGKTTCVGMLDAMFNHSTSLIQGDGVGRFVDSDFVILECCEYMDHFLNYSPYIWVILSIELDHTDYFKNYTDYRNSFIKFANRCDRVLTYDLYHLDLNNEYLVGTRTDSTYYYNIKRSHDKGFIADLYISNDTIKNEQIDYIGEYMVKLYTFCLSVADMLGMNIEYARNNIRKFKCVKRRFNLSSVDNAIFVDDYAHQPSQIKNVFNSVSQMKPSYKKVLIFKPDRLSRINDFYNEFIKSFNLFDEVYLLNNDKDKEELVKRMVKENQKVKMYNSEVGKEKEDAVYCFLSSKKISNELEEVKLNRKALNT